MSGQNKCIEVPAPGESLQIAYRDIPATPPNGLVVKNHFSGICHTDVHAWEDIYKFTDDVTLGIKDFIPSFTFPSILGHEISGEVHSIGNEYKGSLRVGDLVVVYPWCGCENCGSCRAGCNLRCDQFDDHNLGIGQDGGFQHYTAVAHGKYVLPAPEGIPMDVLCTMSCSGLTSYNAVSRIAPSLISAVQRTNGASMLVIGAGGLGIWAVKWAKAMLPPSTKVFVADISEEKLSGAIALGADDSILWERSVSDDALVELTKEKSGGIDGSIDFVGLPATCYRAIMSSNKGATVTGVGLAGGTAKLPLMQMILSGITFIGILVGSLEQMEEQFNVFTQKQMSSPPINRVTPEDTERCLRELKAGTFQGRYVIDWTTG